MWNCLEDLPPWITANRRIVLLSAVEKSFWRVISSASIYHHRLHFHTSVMTASWDTHSIRSSPPWLGKLMTLILGSLGKSWHLEGSHGQSQNTIHWLSPEYKGPEKEILQITSSAKMSYLGKSSTAAIILFKTKVFTMGYDALQDLTPSPVLIQSLTHSAPNTLDSCCSSGRVLDQTP